MTVCGAVNGAAASPVEMTSAVLPVVGGIVARYLRKFERSASISASVWSRAPPPLDVRLGASGTDASPGRTARTTRACAPDLSSSARALWRACAIPAGSRSTSWPFGLGLIESTTLVGDGEPPVATNSAASAANAIPAATMMRTWRRLRAASRYGASSGAEAYLARERNGATGEDFADELLGSFL